MNLIYGVAQVMHRIRVKLYPNYLPGYESTFIARTDSEASLNVEQVCAALRDRGGFKGNYNELVEYVKQYHDETAYQLCDGFAVNNGYYSIYPNLGGTFQNAHEAPDPKKHPLTFRFRPLNALRNLAGSINIVIEGMAETDAYIDEFTDTDEKSVNGFFEPGNLFVLRGNKIKIEGDNPGCGMFFVPTDGSTPVKVTRFNENDPTTLRGIIPEVEWAYNKIEIRTQFSGTAGKPLKSLRVITSSFILEHA